MHDSIKKLIDQRIAEARKKDILDRSMKILKYLGEGIIRQHNSAEDYFDAWESGLSEDKDEMHVEEAGEMNSTEVGRHLDLLNQGCNMQIIYDYLLTDLTITYGGYTVYKESNGDIKKYVPIKEWEEKLESLHKKAKKREHALHITNLKNNDAKAKENVVKLKDYLLKFWGFTFDGQ